MKIVFLGSGAFGIPTLRNLAQHHDIPLVVTQPDRPSGRGRELKPTPIKAMADKLGLPVLAVGNVNESQIVADILQLNAHVGVVIAFGQKIKQELLEGIAGGLLNAHASILPRYRGAAPIHWAMIHGEEKTGVTVFRLVEKMDAGPILATRWTYIKADETMEELHDRLAGIAVDAVRAALQLYEGGKTPTGEPQDELQASWAPKLKKEDGYLRFEESTEKLANHICGVWPWPGGRCIFVSGAGKKQEEVVLARARVAGAGTSQAGLEPGQIDNRMLVTTPDGMLEILEIQPAGGKLMQWQEFVHGRHVQAGDRFMKFPAV